MAAALSPRLLVTLIVFAAALAFPFAASGYHLYQGAQVLILAIALLGLNLLTGFNGQISLGHGAFFAIGGYGAAILTAKLGLPSWVAIPVASLVCFAAGFLFGFPALRFGGLYLALATFALAVATPQILSYTGFDAWTGGSQGVSLAKLHAPFALPLTDDQWFYLVCLVCAAALYWAARNLVRGRIGRALIALRDQPIAAETMGVNAALYKTTCFGVSALYAGVAGGLSAFAVGFVSPESFGLSLSLSFLVGIVVGGLASLERRGVRRALHRIRAQSRRPAFGQFRREREGAAGRDLRRLADPGHGRHADRGRRRVARCGELRRAGVVFFAGAHKLKAAAGRRRRERKKRRIAYAHSTFIPAIERRRGGLRDKRRVGSRRQCAWRHRYGDQDRPDHAL